MEYPTIRRQEDVEDDFHGVKIKDPYRWLEDPDSEESKAFVDAQNSLTVPFINSYHDKENMNKRLTEMWDFPKYGCPSKKGKRYFYGYNSGLQNQPVTYVQDSLDGEARVFIDPNELSEDGTIAVQRKSFTKDGSLCAISISAKGSDWQSVKFIDVATGKYLDDVLKKVKFSCLAWTRNNKGVFYNQYPEAEEHHEGKETDSNTNQKLYYHLLGTPQSDDVMCAEFPDHPKWMSGVETSDDGSYLLMDIREGCDPVNRLYYCEMEKLKDGIKGFIPWVKLIDNFEAEYEYITNEGSVFTFKTNLNSPQYKLINIDFNKPEQSDWVDLVPQHERDVLDMVTCVNQKDLVLVYMHQVKHVMYVCDLSSGERRFTFPLDVGSIQGITGDKDQTELFYYFSSFLVPGSIYRVDMTQTPLQPTVFREVKIQGFEKDKFETKQVFYKSEDSTEVPMFLVHKKSVKLSGDNPVYLYGYGGFNISLTPYFSVSRLLFINHFNGVYALPNIRGGGELGEMWHKGGMLANKQNVFDDFIGAAEWLITEKYTNPEKICINGGSNGGLLVGACANQRPDLFKAVVADVGVMDMLRFHKFTIGHAWITDFGCADNKEDFNYLIKYSPLHNVREPVIGQYPAVLLVTADHDDRVVPLHSYKFIAELQHRLGKSDKQTNPLMIRVETKAGHGGGKPTSKIIESLVEKLTFIALNLDLKWQE